jgi:hypothetical protein
MAASRGEGQSQGLAARPGQRLGRRLAQHRPAEGVGHDQARLLGQDVARKLRPDGEGEGVAVGAVLPPFLIGAEILEAGLHLDTRTLSLHGERFDLTTETRSAEGEISFADAQAADHKVEALFAKQE